MTLSWSRSVFTSQRVGSRLIYNIPNNRNQQQLLGVNSRSFRYIFKSPYFYGVVGVSGLIGGFSGNAISNQNNKNQFQKKEVDLVKQSSQIELSLKKQLEDGQSELEKQKDELSATIKKKEEDLKKAQEKTKKDIENLKLSKQEVEKKEKEILRLKQELEKQSTPQEEQEEGSSEVKILQDKLKQLQRKEQDFQTQMEVKEKEIFRLTQELAQQSIPQEEAEEGSIELKLQKLQNELIEKELKLQKLEGDLKTQTDESEALKKYLQQEKEQLQAKEAELQAQLQAKEEQLEIKETEILRLTKESQTLKQALEKQSIPQEEAEEGVSEIKILQDELREKESQLKKLTEDLKIQREECLKLQAIQTNLLQSSNPAQKIEIDPQVKELLQSYEYSEALSKLKDIKTKKDLLVKKIPRIQESLGLEKQNSDQQEREIFTHIMNRVEAIISTLELIELFSWYLYFPGNITVEKFQDLTNTLKGYLYSCEFNVVKSDDINKNLNSIFLSSQNFSILLDNVDKYLISKQSLDKTEIMKCGMSFEKFFNILFLFVQKSQKVKEKNFIEWCRTHNIGEESEAEESNRDNIDSLIKKAKNKIKFLEQEKEKSPWTKYNNDTEDYTIAFKKAAEYDSSIRNIKKELEKVSETQKKKQEEILSAIFNQTFGLLQATKSTYKDFNSQRSYLKTQSTESDILKNCNYLGFLQEELKTIQDQGDWEEVTLETLKRHEDLIKEDLRQKGKLDKNFTYTSGRIHKEFPIRKIKVQYGDAVEEVYEFMDKESMEKKTLGEIYQLENEFIKSFFQLREIQESIETKQKGKQLKPQSTFTIESPRLDVNLAHVSFDDSDTVYPIFQYYYNGGKKKHYLLVQNQALFGTTDKQTRQIRYDTDKSEKKPIKGDVDIDLSTATTVIDENKIIKEYIGYLDYLTTLFQSVVPQSNQE
jgi:hypothetical protein